MNMSVRPPGAGAPSGDVARESLAQAVGRLRTAVSHCEPPASVRVATNAAFTQRSADGRAEALAGAAPVVPAGRWPRVGRAGWSAAACAALLIASTALLLTAPRDEPTAATLAGAAQAGFIRVAPADRWPRPDPGSPRSAAAAWLVAAELPRERLGEWGLPFDPTRAAEPVRAELLMRPSGEVLAVRVMHDADRR